MSRTYRKKLDGEYIIRGQIIHWDDIDWKVYPTRMGFKYRLRVMKSRDNKPWGKPPKWFKQMNRRIERAQVNNAMRSGKEELPVFKKSDEWNWT